MPNIPAEILAVVDGDTLRVRAMPWRNWSVETLVRVNGIDTPEKGARAKNPREALLGLKATEFARAQFEVGSIIRLADMGDDKYGRCLARVTRQDGACWATLMIEAGLARPYTGGAKSSW